MQKSKVESNQKASTTFSSSKVPTFTILVEDGDDVTTSFGAKEKVIKVGSSVEELFFHVVVVVVEIGKNYVAKTYSRPRTIIVQASSTRTTIVAQTSSKPIRTITQVFLDQ